MSISIIAAIGKNGEIGIGGKLPWHIPEELKKFKSLTENHAVIMGRKTFESIVEKIGKTLPNRTNIIITRNRNYIAPEGCIVANSLEAALREAKDDETFIIGGAEIFTQALPLVEKMYITAIDKEFPADTFFPKIDISEWQLLEISAGHRSETEPISFSYMVYERKRDTLDQSSPKDNILP